MSAQHHPFGVAHDAVATPPEWTYSEDDMYDAKEYILQHGKVGDKVTFYPNNQLGLASYIIVVTNGEKAFRQTHDAYGLLDYSDTDGGDELTDGELSTGGARRRKRRTRRTRRVRNLSRRKRTRSLTKRARRTKKATRRKR
jgi:hypothetical protein